MYDGNLSTDMIEKRWNVYGRPFQSSGISSLMPIPTWTNVETMWKTPIWSSNWEKSIYVILHWGSPWATKDKHFQPMHMLQILTDQGHTTYDEIELLASVSNDPAGCATAKKPSTFLKLCHMDPIREGITVANLYAKKGLLMPVLLAFDIPKMHSMKSRGIHDAKIKNRVFNVGDQVLLFNSRLKIFSGKLKSRWSGPFTIVQVFPYGTVELSQNSRPNFKVNGHRLKHYFGGDIPAMDIPDLQTFLRKLNSGKLGCLGFLKPLVLAVFVLRSQELHNPQLHLGNPDPILSTNVIL
ncbi:hypothetical protein Tco_0295358 [Tanacetum coccineum]